MCIRDRAYPDADIFVLDEHGIEKTMYEQTEHYFITKQFLNHPQRMLDELLYTGEQGKTKGN